ncbi:MAG: hypothetical protein K6T76_01690 [Alicyclobacillus mali]|uniref:hypothetical protein n=1 Tax=Alicyclobacillus TaxID=29330 RepID=UPI0023F04E1E|nr:MULTISPECIES: hypothetical protein [Alicyclobacillus]MCL6487642.1 hypothetical protein [Alicyclobacillus mali (ex Roth et al. 2021)]
MRRQEAKLDVAKPIHRAIGIGTAILLLMRQITVGGVFISPGNISLSLSGFFTGSGADGKNEVDKRLLDAIDFVTALLLIVNELQVIGTYLTAGRFTIVVSGPLFGSEVVAGYTPTAREFARDFSSLVTTVIRPF